jgi:hypothetical protein
MGPAPPKPVRFRSDAAPTHRLSDAHHTHTSQGYEAPTRNRSNFAQAPDHKVVDGPRLQHVFDFPMGLAALG